MGGTGGIACPAETVIQEGSMGEGHRVTITGELYEAARRYMVEHGLPHVRAAVEAMIRAESEASCGLRQTQQEEVLRNRPGNGGRQVDGSSQHVQVPAAAGPRRSK